MEEIVELKDHNNEALVMSNVDLKFGDGTYWLIGNSPDLLTIRLYLSVNGKTFTPFDGENGLLIDGGIAKVNTPELTLSGDETIEVTFGYINNAQFLADSIHTWTYKLE
jgi:acetoin utilization deacetylase AcuC-like enzyme